jgi:hypothetical protein
MNSRRAALTATLSVLVAAVIFVGYRAGISTAVALAPEHASSTRELSLLPSYDGTPGPGYKDHPDASGAAGPDAVVDFTGAGFWVRDKRTGRLIEQMTQSQFWTRAGLHPATINDPRILFDPLSARWFAVESAPYDALAVSADADPTHPWKAVVLTTAVSGDLLERIGVDVRGVYMCSSGRNGHTEAICFALPKKDLLWTGGAAPSLAHLDTFPALPFETFPATDLDPAKPAGAPEVFLTRKGLQNDAGVPLTLLMEQLTWSGTRAHLSGTFSIPTGLMYTVPGVAVQPGGPSPRIKAREDHRILDLVEAGGTVYGAIGTEIAGRVGADWFALRAADGAVLQASAIAEPGRDILFPTVAVDGHGNLAIAFTRTAADEYPSIYVAARKPTDPTDTLRAPILLAGGSAPYVCDRVWGSSWLGRLLKMGADDPIGWGTYSTTVDDPVDPDVLWTFQQYGGSATNCRWSTRWVSFALH